MPIPGTPEPVVAVGRLLSDAVFEKLSVAIVDGTLGEGEVLRDAELAAWLGVSRTPVREAISRLIALGLVETAPSRYTRVTHVDSGLVRETLEFTGYQAALAVRMAIPHLDDAEIAEACSMLDLMIEANEARDAGTLFATSRNFVGYLAVRTRNSVFVKMISEAALQTERNLRWYRPTLGSVAERGECYRELRAAVLMRDADAGEQAFRRQHALEFHD